MMKRGICYGVLLSLTLPLTLLRAEKVNTFNATALKSLDAITREKQEAPALLSVTLLSTSNNNPAPVVQSRGALEKKERVRLKSQTQRLNKKVIPQRVKVKKSRITNRGNRSEVLNSRTSTK